MTEASPGEGQSEVKALRFTASPDQEFERPVMLEITLDESSKETLQVQEGDEDLALFVEEEDGSLRMLVPSSYDPGTGKLTAPTRHFSTFVVSTCGATLCRVGGTSRLTPSENASIFLEPRYISIPKDLPSFKEEMMQKLRSLGWEDSATALEDIENEDFCDQDECSSMVINLKDGSSNVPLFGGLDEHFDLGDILGELPGLVGDIGRFFGSVFSSIFGLGSVDVSGGVTTLTSARAEVTLDAVVQGEQCAVNPLSTSPQLRLNHIPAIRVSITSRIHIGSVNAKWKCWGTCRTSSWLGSIEYWCITTCRNALLRMMLK